MKFINKMISRAAALMLAAGMVVSGTSFADEEENDLKLPSGLSFGSYEKKVEILSNIPGITNKLPPTSVVLFHGDEVLNTIYEGYINIAEDVKNDENAVFEWGSITKTMTWVSIMQLWEQGKIDLDADIRTYLPDNFFRYLRYDDPITVTDLMNHQGGWCESTYAIFAGNENELEPLEDFLRENEPAQTFRPGEVVSYSNWGAALAGLIVERVSGMEYTEYIHKNILEPLGMEHTAVSPDHRDNMWVREQREKLRSYEMPALIPIWEDKGAQMLYCSLYPAGSATGTIGDLTRYAQAFVDDSHPLFENAGTQEKLFSGSAYYGNSDIPCCSYGFWPENYAVRVYGHNGGTLSGSANMIFDPESKVGFVMLTSACDNNGGAGELDNNVLADKLPEYIFGTYSGDDLPSGNETPAEFKGEYVQSRSTLTGIGSFYSLLNTADADKIEGITDIGNGVYKFSYVDNYSDRAEILGKSIYSDGTEGIRTTAMELIPVRMYIPKICLLSAFFLAGISAVFVLLAKRKLKKAKMISSNKGDFIITLAQIAKVVSVLSITELLAFAGSGLSKNVGAAAGIIQMISFVLCAAAAIAGIAFAIKRNSSKYGRIYYLFSVAGNAAAASAIVVFEMYKFWGC